MKHMLAYGDCRVLRVGMERERERCDENLEDADVMRGYADISRSLFESLIMQRGEYENTPANPCRSKLQKDCLFRIYLLHNIIHMHVSVTALFKFWFQILTIHFKFQFLQITVVSLFVKTNHHFQKLRYLTALIVTLLQA